MITDIRARVVCSLGPVISGDISDDYIQGNGVIKTSGSLILSGIFAPAVGQKIELGYISNINGQKVAARIPRTLRVLSSFSDPFKRITTVEIGCLFTYLSDKKPAPALPVSVNSDTVDEEEKKRVIVPVRASSVLAECFSKLGIDYTGAGLTNVFAVEKFDFSAGYVEVISDLLVSEGQFCYLDASEKAIIAPIEVAAAGTGPNLEGRDIIEASPIGTGEQPADNVLVNYDSKRFKKPKSKQELIEEKKAAAAGGATQGGGSSKSDQELEDEADDEVAKDLAKKNWEYERQVTRGRDIKIEYTYSIIPKWEPEEEMRRARAASRDTLTVYTFLQEAKRLFASRTPQSITGATYWPNYSITTVQTKYDQWDRAIYRKTLIEKGLASVAASALSELYSRFFNLEGGGILSISGGSCYEMQIENFKYLHNSKRDKSGIAVNQTTGSFVLDEDSPTDEDFNSLIEKETLTYECYTAIQDSLVDTNISTVSTYNSIREREEDNRFVFGDFDGSPTYLTRRVVELYDKQAAQFATNTAGVSGITGSDWTTKQVTITYVASYLTDSGYNSNLAFNAQKFWNLSQVEAVNRAIDNGTLVVDNIQISQKKGGTSAESRPDRASRLNAAYEKQATGGQTAEIELTTTAAGKGTYKELTMPYASDDILSYDATSDTYTLQASDARQKALNYGRIQNALLLGNRNGISIQISANLMPPKPFSPIIIRASGVSGVYRTNGTSYTFDSNGIIASTDALFVGGIK